MMRLFFLLFIFALLTACNKGEPRGVLSKEEMQPILWEYLQADIYAHAMNSDSSRSNSLINAALQTQIFKRHHTTAKVFYKSYDYYIARSKDFTEIVDSMVATQKRKDTIGGRKPILPTVEVSAN